MKDEKKEKLSLFQRLKKRKRLIIALGIVVICFFVYWFFLKGNGNGDKTEVKRGSVREELILTGEITADEYAQLFFPTSGKIAWVGVEEGDWVNRGQGLTKLDTTVLNAAFQQAKATLRAAEATVDNVHDQVQDSDDDETFAQRDARTTAEAAKDRAYDAYVAAEYNLRNATITSPFDGLVTYLAHTYSGVNVIFSEMQVEVINPDTLYFDVSADQSEVFDISKGQKVIVVLDSLSDEEMEGVVDFVSYTPKAGEVGAVYKVKVKFVRTDMDIGVYRIGMTGDAIFVKNNKEDVLYLPTEFINTDSEGTYVKKGKSDNKTYIEVGLEGEERVEVSGDIKEGDIVYD